MPFSAVLDLRTTGDGDGFRLAGWHYGGMGGPGDVNGESGGWAL